MLLLTIFCSVLLSIGLVLFSRYTLKYWSLNCTAVIHTVWVNWIYKRTQQVTSASYLLQTNMFEGKKELKSNKIQWTMHQFNAKCSVFQCKFISFFSIQRHWIRTVELLSVGMQRLFHSIWLWFSLIWKTFCSAHFKLFVIFQFS